MGNIIKKTFIVFLTLIVLIKDAYSLGYEAERDSNFKHDVPSMCDTGDMGSFDVFGSNNKDMEWVLTNPVCYGFIAGLGAAILTSSEVSSGACVATAGLAVSSPYAAMPTNTAMRSSPVLDFSTGTKFFAVAFDCANRVGLNSSAAAALAACTAQAAATAGAGASACALPASYAAAASTDQFNCCASYAAMTTSVTAGLAYLGGLFETAKETYENARACGHDWYSWQEEDVNGIATSGGGYWRRGSYAHSYSKRLNDVFIHGLSDADISATRSLENKHYREFFYGGREFSDDSCSAPSNWSANDRMTRLGYDDGGDGGIFSSGGAQRYYMKGPGLTSNYACHRYLTSGTRSPNDEEMAAYDCCVSRSQSTMCIENYTNIANTFSSNIGTTNYDYQFCKIGDQCGVGGVGFVVNGSMSQVNTLCAQTKTLCPYDHLLGGGTEYRHQSESVNGSVINSRVQNYCQFNKHCVKIPARPYIRINNYDSAFIANACMNFIGHSQNTYNNSNELLPVSNIKHFSAPLVECMAETVQNMIQNRAGYTQCTDPDESPRRVGSQYICDGGYDFREGDLLTTPSPFQKLQNFLRGVVQLVLVLSVAFLGYTTLLALKPIDKKTILIYIMKFAFVVYFALGTGWQDLFIDSVFKISSELGNIVMKTDPVAGTPLNWVDGCQFPKFDASLTRDASTYPDPADDPFYAVSNPQDRKYTPGYEYLKPWDTLDCKFVRALGFGPEMSVPNLILTILAGLLTGGLGMIFVVFTFIFAFFYIGMIMRAIHIFLVSTIAIALLIFVSPLTITAIMFQKTKSIFDGWLKQLIGFIVQPMILFAYIAIFIGVMDHAVYGIRHDLPANGGITFSGDGLDQPKGTICSGDANSNSIYCIFGFSRFGSYSGLEPIGILLPFIFDITTAKLNTIIEAGLLMYIFSLFMDKISDLAGELTGSKAITSKTPGAAAIARKVGGVARGVQKRGTRVAGSAITGAGKKAGRAAASVANQGKQMSRKNSGTDSSSAGGKEGPKGGGKGPDGGSSDA